MPTKIHWVYEAAHGARLGIMARPRGGEWLREEVVALQRQGVTLVVSLLEQTEAYELELLQEAAICGEAGVDFIQLPIPDRSLPATGLALDALLNKMTAVLDGGGRVVVHCRMGIGRSSIIAGAVLLRYGQRADDIINHIGKVRGLRVPDTEEQANWLRRRSA